MAARTSWPTTLALLLTMISGVRHAGAHPMVEDALDVVIEPRRIIVEAKIAREQVQLVESHGAPGTADRCAQWRGHTAPTCETTSA